MANYIGKFGQKYAFLAILGHFKRNYGTFFQFQRELTISWENIQEIVRNLTKLRIQENCSATPPPISPSSINTSLELPGGEYSVLHICCHVRPKRRRKWGSNFMNTGFSIEWGQGDTLSCPKWSAEIDIVRYLGKTLFLAILTQNCLKWPKIIIFACISFHSHFSRKGLQGYF